MKVEDEVRLQAKLSLDTSEAERDLEKLGSKGTPLKVSIPKDQKIELPKESMKEVKKLFSDDKGLKNMSRILRGASGGVRGLTSALGSIAVPLGIVSGIVILISRLLRGTDTGKQISRSLTHIVDTIRDGLAPALAVVGEIFDALADVFEELRPVMREIGVQLANGLIIVLDLVKALKPLISLLSDLLVLSYQFFGMSGLSREAILSKTSTTATKLTGIRSSLDTWETVGIEDTLKDISESSNSIAEDVGNSIDGVTSSLSSINETLSSWSGWASSFYHAFDPIFDPLKKWLFQRDPDEPTFGEATKDFVEGIKEGTKEFGQNFKEKVVQPIKGLFSYLGSKIKHAVKRDFGFADGGTLDIGAQVWAMNEPGNPEFIFNAGGHDTVINKQILSDALYDALVRAGKGGKQELEVKVAPGTPSGPRELAQWLLPSLRFLIARGG